ncbi:hypothetical protein PR048_012963 [Dryococelus australis]|uniref:Uncharacterized protein n=1 Tax=Dryococelus australis TaxID=614101 RepID=A0ABQ9HQZ8_9NEOP|nr:hypothetical protein PR048_012963 [Dryococelus australis]
MTLQTIKLVFTKKTVEVITDEIQVIEAQISKPTPMPICMAKSAIQVCYMLLIYAICVGAKPSEMNDFSSISAKSVNKEFLSFALSPLYSWIQFFECILHVSLDCK